jgi:hypothetical protein
LESFDYNINTGLKPVGFISLEEDEP